MRRFAKTETNWLEISGETATLLDRAPWLGGQATGAAVGVSSAKLVTPVAPSKIVCVGKNYRAHAKEMGGEVPREPLLFLKPPSSLLASGGTLRLPPESARVEHEGELAVVIGTRGRRIPVEHALEHVFGFTVACDVTARDLQKKDGQWSRAKGFDGFCPVGTEIVCDIDPGALGLRVLVNDQIRQDGNTRDMVFDVASLVAFASNVMTLSPGDLILTGTPEGVGPIVAGDHVQVEIQTVGVLDFSVEAEAI